MGKQASGLSLVQLPVIVRSERVVLGSETLATMRKRAWRPRSRRFAWKATRRRMSSACRATGSLGRHAEGFVKAAGIERFGGDVRELSLPDPCPAGAGETLITVRAAGVGALGRPRQARIGGRRAAAADGAGRLG